MNRDRDREIFRGCNKYIEMLEKENAKLKHIIKNLEMKNYNLLCKIGFLNKRIKIFNSPLKPLDECNSD